MPERFEQYDVFAEFTAGYVYKGVRSGAESFRLEWVAGAVAPISGYSADEILKLGGWMPLIHPDDRPTVAAHLLDMLPGDRKTIKFRIVNRQQEVRWVSEKNRCEAGAAAGELVLFGAVTDVTEQAQEEEERKRYQAMLYQNQKMELVGRLASGVAHEINNPVTGLVNCAQLLINRNAVSEEHQPILHRIIREGDRIAAIVQSLLFFSRDSGEGRGVFPVQDLLVDVLQICSNQLAKEGVDLQLDVPKAAIPINVNPQQFDQVLLNLISNAQYALQERCQTVAGEKVLKIAVEHVPGDSGDLCRIRVEDNGTGIPAALLEKLGQPFVTTKPAGVGTGLGLSISQDIVRRHGGELRISSREGAFTEVIIELPLMAADD
ncbi:MAG: PAS domain S-box protein [Deltaproteobacteria bacterium]|nr:MAG: PAS domain S-box protein [Deltaproteobacteria bacterium]